MGRKLVPEENDLKTMRPDLAKEWSPRNLPLGPEQVTCGSEQKVWWICAKGHEWRAIVSNRSKHGQGCPYCSGKRVIPRENDLATLRPDLAAEWSERNLPLQPDQIKLHANKKVWWRCAAGHEWQARVYSRTSKRGNGCPYCNGRRVIAGKNDLATLYPEIAEQWHERNLPLKPDQVTGGSNKKVWWKCDEGHAWQATICTRTRRGTECPYCKGNKVIVGENDLGTVYPNLAAEWSNRNLPLRPDQVSYGSGRKVWWICRKNHEWRTMIAHRSLEGSGCPFCSGRKAVEGENDLWTMCPDLAAEWSPKNFPLQANQVKPQSNRRVWWRCASGHEWQAVVSDRSNGKGCPYCSGRLVITGENDLATLRPEIAAEWSSKNFPLYPDQVKAGSNRTVWWQCKEGHEWQATVNERTQGRGCPYCAGQRVTQGENDLATMYPTLAAEWSKRNQPLEPSQVKPGSNRRVWWQCKENGHEWQATVNSRVQGTGCPYCAGQRVLLGENDLATMYPALAAEWSERNFPLKPNQVMFGSSRKVWWRCAAGHEWQAAIRTRTAGHGCPYCQGLTPRARKQT